MRADFHLRELMAGKFVDEITVLLCGIEQRQWRLADVSNKFGGQAGTLENVMNQ